VIRINFFKYFHSVKMHLFAIEMNLWMHNTVSDTVHHVYKNMPTTLPVHLGQLLTQYVTCNLSATRQKTETQLVVR
jgi:hypothetical protein